MDDKIFICKFSNNVKSKRYHIENSKRANKVDLDEVAHSEPPHQDLHCLQIQLFLSLVVKELKNFNVNVEAEADVGCST